MSDADFVRHQAHTARLAIKQTSRELQRRLGTGEDLLRLVRQHPWASLGVTALAACVATSALSGMGRAKTHGSSTGTSDRNTNSSGPAKTGMIGSIFSGVQDALINTAQTLVLGAVSDWLAKSQLTHQKSPRPTEEASRP